jgi:hypothetical protein
LRSQILGPGPGADLGHVAPDARDRTDGHTLEVELIGDQRPPAVLFADQVGRGHPDVLVEGGAGELAGHRGQWGPAEPGCVDRHDEDQQPLVLRDVRVGAGRQPHVVRVLDGTGVELLSVDDALVAVAPGPFKSKMMAATLDAFGEQIAVSAPLKRIGRPDDVVDVALLLASRAGTYLTGAVIPVDGGIATVG